jgi:hypothetical protein
LTSQRRRLLLWRRCIRFPSVEFLNSRKYGALRICVRAAGRAVVEALAYSAMASSACARAAR